MELGAPRRARDVARRKPIAGSEFSLDADIVLIAYGFDPAPTFAASNAVEQIEVNQWGGVVIDARSNDQRPGCFRGRRFAGGPSLVVHAVRDGRQAAAGIHQYLQERRESSLHKKTSEFMR